MKYLLVPDKFKGSLSAKEVIQALEKGILKADPQAQFYSALLSDGGDGFLDSASHYTAAEKVWVDTQDPLGRPLRADYLFDQQTSTAYVEMARTAGLELLKSSERSPLNTSTYGTGLQIKHALEQGAKKVFVGLGGSATNDAGMGIATAMGYKFLNSSNAVLSPVGASLQDVVQIIVPADNSLFKEARIYAINDVNNPLYGSQGAAYVYAAQKGANEKQIDELDQGLRNLNTRVQQTMALSNAAVPGAGAAGGTAYGLMSFLDADFIGGAKFVLELAGVPALLEKEAVDYIITGEGKIDEQTLRGKLIHGILEQGMAVGVPVIGICGALDANKESLQQLGLADVIEVRDPSRSLEYNMKKAAILVENAIHEFISHRQ